LSKIDITIDYQNLAFPKYQDVSRKLINYELINLLNSEAMGTQFTNNGNALKEVPSGLKKALF
jgi:hypothetical protein